MLAPAGLVHLGAELALAFLVALGAPMMVASTIVPVPTFMPWACSTSPTLVNGAAARSCFSRRRQNFSSVVAVDTLSGSGIRRHRTH
jgi:hypothetical protein